MNNRFVLDNISEGAIGNDINVHLYELSLEEQVKISIIKDLINLNWHVEFKEQKIEILPPKFYDKESIKYSMSFRRREKIIESKEWILKNMDYAISNLANGKDVLKSKIIPIIQECKTNEQHVLFRMFRYYWSSPYSEYVGRRIRLLIRDGGLPNIPVIGIAALGSPIIHIPDRDKWIGWNRDIRTKNLIYTMDAYVVGALPPYNYILGGKLISLLLTSNEVRKIYQDKYKDKISLIAKRKSNKLVAIFTTSLYGRSSQYNRLFYKNRLLFNPIGETKGYGTFHLSNATINKMNSYLKSKNIYVSNKFGDGPSWSMRVIRTSGELLGFNSDFLLRHSFQRKIYFIPLASNSIEYLNNQSTKIKYLNYSNQELVDFWRERWLKMRLQNHETVRKVQNFLKEDFFHLIFDDNQNFKLY